MEQLVKISIFLILFLSCGQKPTETEKEYIKNLEEKNELLENELRELNGETSTADSNQEEQQNKASTKGYFTIGSTEDEVLEVMGDPTSYHKIGTSVKIFYYGSSNVHFSDGRVDSYSNIDENLKVKVK